MADADVEALRAELSKWQERVPKLAGALRERSNEVEALKAQLADRSADAPAAAAGSGIQARDALIEELEAKVKALGGKYQDAEGQLHARDLEITQLRQEAEEWREKWQSVTSSLDTQADNAGQKDRELKRLKGELDELLALQGAHTGRIKEQDLELTQLRERAQSLEGRNENLFETTELANRQIETLGENLEHLRSELAGAKDLLAKHEAAAGELAKETQDLKSQVASRDQDIQFLHTRIEEKQTENDRLAARVEALAPLEAANADALADKAAAEKKVENLNDEIAALSERLIDLDAARKSLSESEARIEALEGSVSEGQAEVAHRDEQLTAKAVELSAQTEEVQRLETCVANAEEATIRHEVERRQLSEQLSELKKRNQHLESQLSERSDLVMGLEQEKSAITDKTSSLEAENTRLSEALEKAQQLAAGNADHIAQVDARMERQMQLMENLEEEFAEVQGEYAAAVKSHQRALGDKDAEIATLKEKVEDDSVAALKQELQKQALAAAAAELALRQARAELSETQAQTSPEPDDVSDENAALQAEVIKLEGMVRERTEQLNKLRWQQDMIEKQGGSDGNDSKMLVVLNQQLQSTREENQRLKDKVRELESTPASSPAAVEHAGCDEPDELSSIKGIGPKLVKQLRKRGVTRFDQIATLSESDLDDDKHPLHSMKGRIIKDNWIEQAAKLGGIV